MNYRKKFLVSPGQKIQLGDVDPSFSDPEEEVGVAQDQEVARAHGRVAISAVR